MSSIRPIRVIHEVVYDEDQIQQYEEYCDNYDEAATQRGFESWCKDDIEDDFGVPVSALDIRMIAQVGFATE